MRIGKSDKPDIDYTVFEHIDYVNQFIETLNLKDITLVVHGWDSVIRFDSARRNNANVKVLAFFESHIHQATDWKTLSLPVQQLATLLHRPDTSYRAIIEQNYLNLINYYLQEYYLSSAKKIWGIIVIVVPF